MIKTILQRIRKVYVGIRTWLSRKDRPSIRIGVMLGVVVIVLSEIATLSGQFLNQDSYALGNNGSMLSPIDDELASKLQLDTSSGEFNFNNGQALPTSETLSTGANLITANAYQDASKGVTVTDPVNKIDFSLTPNYNLLVGKKDGNRIVYPFSDGSGWVVYTMHTTGVKEDIVLSHAPGKTLSLDYTLGLANGLEARAESDGSIGIYGNTLLSSDITTGSSADAALLQKARANAKKDTFLFSIPKPVIVQGDHQASKVSASYTLKGNDLRMNVTGLTDGHYPLSIDPSIYVVSAQQFMRGNNETNINFDVADKLIEKGPTTGARFNSWNTTTAAPNAAWAGGTAASGGYMYTAGGTTSGSTVSNTVAWSQLDSTTGVITAPNPGSGACTTWCTNSSYNLPTARTNLSLVVYNGFLYAMGGVDGTGTRQSTVYIAKLGANGEPRLWHPTDTNQANWVYWYTDSGLSSARSDFSALAYNNRMYIVGGRTTSGVVSSVEIANINPTGTLGGWASSTALPSALYGQGMQMYNDRLYILGGAASVGGAPTNAVYYNKINTDGSLNSWVSTSSFSTGRFANGGTMSVVLGGYIYISGGCSAVNGSGYCTTVASDSQYASINADGSLDTWSTMGGVSSTRMGTGMVAWGNVIYEIAGCSAQNTTTGDCNSNLLSSSIYGTINQGGDVSATTATSASGSGACTGTTPTGCNLPGSTNIGNLLTNTIITNGYLYVIGGCTNNPCTTTTGNVAYVSISSTGTMSKPAACTGGSYVGGSWCVNTTNTVSGGIAAASPVVFNNTIYLVGGLNGTANTNTIVRTTVASDGSVSAWTSQSMTGVGATSVSYLYAYVRANPASAGTNPGNLYIFGGCTTSSGAACSGFSQAVSKCNILVSGDISGCTTTGQLQIGIIPGDTAAGLGLMSGAVFGNYVYLLGGISPNQYDLATVRYAKIDNNNNIVAATGTTWTQSPNQLVLGRSRSSAFASNGYLYTVGGYTSNSTTVYDIEFIKINTSDGSLGTGTSGFSVSSSTIAQRWGLSVSVSNSIAYVIGGCNQYPAPSSCTVRYDPIETFQIYNNDSGAPAGYIASTGSFANDADRIGISATVLNGYIYVAGGCTTMNCSSYSADVEQATLNQDGSIGTWSNATGNLPAARAFGKLETAGGSLYYMGGKEGTCTPTGNSLFQKYSNISGTAVSSLYASSNYPNNPDVTQTLNDGYLESPFNIDDNFGAKVSAILCPPTTGTYSFWVASDDNSELRLSTDNTAANATAIASINGVGSYTNVGQWTKYSSQHSANVTLTAGKPYYIEVNYKEATGNDFAQIGWTLPSGTSELPIPATRYLAPTEASSKVFYTTPRNSSYQYRQPLTINHSQVSGTSNLTSFPVQVSLTSTALKTVANGGTIQNSSGYDMMFTAGDGTTALPYEVESYNASTGQLLAWVNVPSISYNADTPIYLYYDNSNISTFQGNINSTWSSIFNSVLHLPNGSTLSTADSTVNNIPGTNNGATATTGKVDGGANFNGGGQYINYASALPSSGNFTASLWFKTTSSGVLLSDQNQPIGSTATSYDPMLYVDSVGKLRGGLYGSSGFPNLVSTANVNDGAWHNAVLVANHTGGTQTLYLDGSFVGTTTDAPGTPFSYISLGAGYDASWPNAPASPTSYFNGQIDEVHIVNNASQTSDWVTTSYNTVNTPSTFVTSGTVQSYGATYDNWYGGSGGSLNTWSTASNGLPTAVSSFGSAVWNNRLYVVGGNATSGLPQNTVYVSPQLNSGGDITSAWSTTSTSFNVSRSGLTAIPYANNLYILGGFDGTNYLSDVQYAKISTTDGSVGSWSYSASLPTPLSDADGFAVNGYMYLIGGRSAATTCRPITLVTAVSANTTIASGNLPTGIGSWYETGQRYTGDRYGAAAIYNGGSAYVIGGGCSSFVSSANRIYRTSILSEPQVAKYSIMIDTDTDVYPTNWLLNGTDNSIGAQWLLKYRSMTNTTTSCTSPAMTTWGVQTIVGTVSLGVPGIYTPLDGSGVTTNCARFYYFNLSVDSSQAYGYPDDITRGPTITDLTLQFTADPSKHLIHGKTFTGGLAQPLDTPYYSH